MPRPLPNDQPYILLERPFEFEGQSLAEALEATVFAVCEVAEGESLEKVLESIEGAPDLLVLTLGAEQEHAIALLTELRRNRIIGSSPVLGVSRFDQMALDIPKLRALGVVGLVDERASCETALRRIEQTFGAGHPGRQAERARCFLPLTLIHGDQASEEFALDVSSTGMRLTVSEPLESNTDVTLRFRLIHFSEDELEIRARTIHRTSIQNSAGRWEMGSFFYPMAPEHLVLIEAEITRLLQPQAGPQ